MIKISPSGAHREAEQRAETWWGWLIIPAKPRLRQIKEKEPFLPLIYGARERTQEQCLCLSLLL